MTVYSFTITEYDPQRRWVVVSTGRDRIELPEGQDFNAWACERYPSERFRIELEREPLRRQ